MQTESFPVILNAVPGAFQRGAAAEIEFFLRCPQGTFQPAILTVFWGAAGLFSSLENALLGRESKWPLLTQSVELRPGADSKAKVQLLVPEDVSTGSYFFTGVLWHQDGRDGEGKVDHWSSYSVVVK